MPLTLPNVTSVQAQNAASKTGESQPLDINTISKQSSDKKIDYGGYDSFEDWYYHTYGVNPDNAFMKLENLFSGDLDRLRASWTNWYNAQAPEREAQIAYETQKKLTEGQFQWFVEGAKKAGLNPYALLSQGGASIGNQTFGGADVTRLKTGKDKSDGNAKALIAGLAYIIGAIVKAVI